IVGFCIFFFSSRRRHTRFSRDWSSDVCSSDLLVARIRAGQGGVAAGPDYLALARRLACERDPRLLIAHGLSGSGKSYVSQRLLERAGAIRLRSDVERKRLFGLRALADASAGPGEGIYAADASQRTYERLLA